MGEVTFYRDGNLIMGYLIHHRKPTVNTTNSKYRLGIELKTRLTEMKLNKVCNFRIMQQAL